MAAGQMLVLGSTIDAVVSICCWGAGLGIDAALTQKARKELVDYVGETNAKALLKDVKNPAELMDCIRELEKAGYSPVSIWNAADTLSGKNFEKLAGLTKAGLPKGLGECLAKNQKLLENTKDEVLLLFRNAKSAPENIVKYPDQGGDTFVHVYKNHGDKAVDALLTYGDETLSDLYTYGHTFFDLQATYGDDFASLYTRYRGQAIEKLFEYQDELITIAKTYGDEGVELVMKYDDIIVDGLRKYKDEFIEKYRAEGDAFIDEFYAYGDEVFEVETVSGVYTDKIKWGIHEIEVRRDGNGFWGHRIRQSNSRVDSYELKINPQDESYYLPHPEGGYVQFENMINSTVQDGKLVMQQKSFYHVNDMPDFAKNKVLAEAKRQIDAADAANYQVEWLVSDENAVNQLTEFFKEQNLDIIITFYPE